MTTYKQLKRALGGRDEFLDSEDANVWGEWDDVGEGYADAVDLVLVVFVCGVFCVVPTTLDALTQDERTYVLQAATERMNAYREYEEACYV